jgi:subtilisin family serine protease
MRTVRIAVALLFLPLSVWAGVERIRGPRAAPVPDALPFAVRTPPARVESYDAGIRVPLDPDVLMLHAQGFTGKGLGIAIIDQFLLTSHEEFAGRIRLYDEVDATREEPAGWHGTAVASIAAGRTTGVAPEADLYYVGLGVIWSGERSGGWFAAPLRLLHTGQALPLAIRRILDVNRQLEPARKIRALSISVGKSPVGWLDGTDAAIADARREGLFVSTVDLCATPSGPFTVASPTATTAFATLGPAASWSYAYWAARYVLAVQQDGTMTPQRFTSSIARGALMCS